MKPQDNKKDHTILHVIPSLYDERKSHIFKSTPNSFTFNFYLMLSNLNILCNILYLIHLLFLIMNYNYLTNFLQTSLLPNANLILLVYMNIKDVTHLN